MSSATWWTAGAGGRRRRRRRRRRAGRRRRRSRRRRGRGRRGGRWMMRKRVQQPNVMIKVRKKMNIWWSNFKDPVFQMFCDTSKYNQFFKQYILFSIFVKLSKQHWFFVSLSPPPIFLKRNSASVMEFICTTIENELVAKTLLQNQPNTTTFIYWRTNTSCQYFLGKIYNIC